MFSGNDCMIHVANLPDNANEKFLQAFFSDCGNVVQVSTRKRDKTSPMFAFVTFDNKESAIKAVNEHNYTCFNDEPIVITYASVENMRIIYNGTGNVYVKDLDENIEASQLHNLFSRYGEVISCKVPTINRKNRGYAYIQFKYESDARRAIDELDGVTLNGSRITCVLYTKNSQNQPLFVDRNKIMNEVFTNVFICNLPDSVQTLADLVSLFINFGPIRSARLLPEQRAGFVNMADHESAVRAINNLNRSKYYGQTLYATRALLKDERLAYNKML